MKRCIHCERQLLPGDAEFRYPLSGAVADLRCVSQPSSAQMDALIAERQAQGLL